MVMGTEKNPIVIILTGEGKKEEIIDCYLEDEIVITDKLVDRRRVTR